MNDEDELVRRLRICPDYNEGCVRCPHEHDLGCRSTTMREAAEVIEKLQADKAALNDTVTNLLEQIKDIGKFRWIPVSERMPGSGIPVLICGDGNVVEQGVFDDEHGYWYDCRGYRTFVHHWMPLPQNPKGE